jgi:UPF0755 protein
MSKQKKFLTALFFGFIILALFAAWHIFGPNTVFEENKKSFFIKAGSSYAKVERGLIKNGFVKNGRSLNKIAMLLKYPDNIKPGKYVFEKNASVYSILTTLLSGKQTPVNLVISKLRTKEEFAQKIAANFETDSANIIAFLNSKNSLVAYQLDSSTVMTAIIPGNYSILWDTPFSEIFNTLFKEQEKFWTSEREKQAASHNLTKTQAYILASIVEEETSLQDEKGKIASVYINRMETGMRLGADPTVKFALRDFSLKRIYQKHLSVSSPYNTYQVSGLPPGPICTPSTKTIDAVLNSPATSYLYFVAKPDFSGYSNFAVTYSEHLQYAKAYQQALDTLMKKKAAANDK